MAQQSDKWHHTMSRYLGQNPDTSFLFGIIPGVCREALGRPDFLYTNQQAFRSDKVYTWSKFHHSKINSNRFTKVQSYYGTAPFLWELAKSALHLPRQQQPAGSLFFLPRDDQVTIREPSYHKVQELLERLPRPVTVLLPWRQCDIWEQWKHLTIPDDYTIIQLSNPITRQSTLSQLFLHHQHIYIPWPGTDVYYAEFLHKDIHVYDNITQYRTKTKDEMDREMELVLNHLKWGYDYLSINQKKYFEWTTDWADIAQPDRDWLVTNFLGLDVIKSPQELFYDMKLAGMLESSRKEPAQQSVWYDAYQWLCEHKPPTHNNITEKGLEMFALI